MGVYGGLAKAVHTPLIKLVPGPGFEPGLRDSKSLVLPLDHPGLEICNQYKGRLIAEGDRSDLCQEAVHGGGVWRLGVNSEERFCA